MLVGVDPRVGERQCALVREEFVEALPRLEETGVLRIHHTAVPLQTVAQGLSGDVAVADEAVPPVT